MFKCNVGNCSVLIWHIVLHSILQDNFDKLKTNPKVFVRDGEEDIQTHVMMHR